MDLDVDTLQDKTQPNPPPPTKTTLTTTTSKSKTRILTTATLKNPPFAYAHLSLATPSPPPPPATTHTSSSSNPPLDALQVRAYLTAALRQFLGDTGAGMPIDILQVRDESVWVRVAREDLAAFAAGVTAFGGLSPSSSGGGGGGTMLLQLRACGDWLGSLIGKGEEAGLWTC